VYFYLKKTTSNPRPQKIAIEIPTDLYLSIFLYFNKAIAGLIAAMPIGMPSSIFIDDKKVEQYAYNLLIIFIF